MQPPQRPGDPLLDHFIPSAPAWSTRLTRAGPAVLTRSPVAQSVTSPSTSSSPKAMTSMDTRIDGTGSRMSTASVACRGVTGHEGVSYSRRDEERDRDQQIGGGMNGPDHFLRHRFDGLGQEEHRARRLDVAQHVPVVPLAVE